MARAGSPAGALLVFGGMRATGAAAAAAVRLAVHLVLVRLQALLRVHLDLGQRAPQEAGLGVSRS